MRRVGATGGQRRIRLLTRGPDPDPGLGRPDRGDPCPGLGGVPGQSGGDDPRRQQRVAQIGGEDGLLETLQVRLLQTESRRGVRPCRPGPDARWRARCAHPVLRHGPADRGGALSVGEQPAQGPGHPAHPGDRGVRRPVPARHAGLGDRLPGPGRAQQVQGHGVPRGRHDPPGGLRDRRAGPDGQAPPGRGARALRPGRAHRPGDRLADRQADRGDLGQGPAGALERPALRHGGDREDPRGSAEESQRDRPRGAAPGAGEAVGRAAVELRLLRRPQGRPRDGHPLGQLAAGRGAGPQGPDEGDPPVPQLGPGPDHPRPAEDAGARAAEHGRLPQAGREALDRLAHRGGRRFRHAPRRGGRRHLPGEAPRDTADLQPPAVRQR
ncbi:hypothetical protein SGRI78S_03219 [Streptomyces griseus subsp. griseus]